MKEKKLLLVRNEKFVKLDDKIYIVGSSSNKLYDNNEYSMTKVDYLSWNMPSDKYDVSKLELYKKHDNIGIILNDNNISFFKKCKIIKNEVKKTDIVVAKLSINDAIVACHYALRYKKHLVIESASDAYAALHYHGGSIKYKLAALPIDLLSRHYHKKADYIVYVSQFFLQKKYPRKAISIGCPDVILEPTPEEILFNRISRIKSNHEFVVGLIGATQAEYRGHDTLINAVGLLKKKGIIVKIKFLGGGTMNDKRISCAKKNDVLEQVEFCGRVPRDQVFSWIDAIDVLAMPTMVESLGRAAIEAMSRGCPVIGTIETALSEIIPGDNLIHAKDYKSLARIIKKIYSDKDYAETCAKTNFYTVKRYENDRIINTRKTFYDSIWEEVKKWD